MVLSRLISPLIGHAETRLGVSLDYTRKIVETDIWLLIRYNKIFGFLDPNRNVPPAACAPNSQTAFCRKNWASTDSYCHQRRSITKGRPLFKRSLFSNLLNSLYLQLGHAGDWKTSALSGDAKRAVGGAVAFVA